MTNINFLLQSLGITNNYRGYRYILLAINLVLENEDRLESVVNKVYYSIAKTYNINWTSVERNMRTLVNRAWNVNPKLLIEIAGYPMNGAPTTSEFLCIITNYINRNC